MNEFIKGNNWEKEFEERFVNKTFPFLGGQRNFWKGGSQDEMKQIDDIKDFISNILYDYKSKVIEVIESNQKGSFTDDAEHNCWYADDLINVIKNL